MSRTVPCQSGRDEGRQRPDGQHDGTQRLEGLRHMVHDLGEGHGSSLVPQRTWPAASRTASSRSFGLTSSSLATCFSAFRAALSRACCILLSPTTTSAACPVSISSPNSLTSLLDMPRHRWPPTPPTAAPTSAVPMTEGGNKMPTTAPAAAPPRPPCGVAVSSLLTCTLPLSSFVTRPASYDPTAPAECSSLTTW